MRSTLVPFRASGPGIARVQEKNRNKTCARTQDNAPSAWLPTAPDAGRFRSQHSASRVVQRHGAYVKSGECQAAEAQLTSLVESAREKTRHASRAESGRGYAPTPSILCCLPERRERRIARRVRQRHRRTLAHEPVKRELGGRCADALRPCHRSSHSRQCLLQTSSRSACRARRWASLGGHCPRSAPLRAFPCSREAARLPCGGVAIGRP